MPQNSQTVPTAHMIEPSDEFRPRFNQCPFQFEHTLANHPLFTLPRLLELAKSTQQNRPMDLYYDTGDSVRVDQRWNQMGPKPPVEEALAGIEKSGAWITLHQSQKDPEYGELFHQCMREFEELTGVDVRKVRKVEDALIFISSPNRITPYHIDRECNFLLQVRGVKTVYVFDQTDRDVLTEKEVERFWTVDNNSAVYKKELQNRAKAFDLQAGEGVHIPVNAPHWVQNGADFSVSLSVNFTHKDSERANAYRANFFLRKLGLNPTPPGQSPVRDAAKGAVMAVSFVPAMQAARSTVRFIRRLKENRDVQKRPAKPVAQ
jgi:cupin-like protein